MQFKQCLHPYYVEKKRLKHILLGQKLAKNCDRDSEVKICLQPGLEAQKVENHCNSRSNAEKLLKKYLKVEKLTNKQKAKYFWIQRHNYSLCGTLFHF